ncbi:MAG TPA: hypothetical protein VMA97_11465 [Streptosporangiaceae bacterium]|nr:hypothetical protein [Streptosporangiaceae bacterium]
MGAEVLRGDLNDTGVLRAGATPASSRTSSMATTSPDLRQGKAGRAYCRMGR